MLKQSESKTNSSSDEDVETPEDLVDGERTEIREKISSLSFEDLLKMKEEMGSKLYNSTMFGVTRKKSRMDFKRANKNRPREMSSKIRLKQIRKELNNSTSTTSVIQKVLPRDPRFDPLCGQFDDKSFKSNYKFINDIRHSEKKQLEKELKSCTDPERKKTIKLLIQRTDNQLREQQKNEAENSKKSTEMRGIKEKLKKGEKPVFKKKSVKKLENLIEKYEQLKKTNKLQKHIEKRSKKLSSRDRRKLENQSIIN